MGWFAHAWERVRSLRGDAHSRDDELQGQAAATLDGIDARVARSFNRAANLIAFDPTGGRLLMGVTGRDDHDRAVSRLGLENLLGQQPPVELTLSAFGVVGFRHADGVPLFLERDQDDPSILRLRDASTGKEIIHLTSPLTVPCAITAHTLSGDGTRTAGVVRPLARKSGNAPDEGPSKDEPRYDGDTATLVVWDLATRKAVAHHEQANAGPGRRPVARRFAPGHLGPVRPSAQRRGLVRKGRDTVGEFPSNHSRSRASRSDGTRPGATATRERGGGWPWERAAGWSPSGRSRPAG